MFCPKCGNADQQINTFCRACGTFLPDFDKLESAKVTPEQHFTANSVLNAMTAIVSLALAITLYVIFLGKEDTPFVIYLTAGFLTAMFAWQVQVFWRTLLLKKQFPGLNRKKAEAKEEQAKLGGARTKELLSDADFSAAVPPSVAERTTDKLGEKIKR